jgi:hypothetical protein
MPTMGPSSHSTSIRVPTGTGYVPTATASAPADLADGRCTKESTRACACGGRTQISPPRRRHYYSQREMASASPLPQDVTLPKLAICFEPFATFGLLKASAAGPHGGSGSAAGGCGLGSAAGSCGSAAGGCVSASSVRGGATPGAVPPGSPAAPRAPAEQEPSHREAGSSAGTGAGSSAPVERLT